MPTPIATPASIASGTNGFVNSGGTYVPPTNGPTTIPADSLTQGATPLTVPPPTPYVSPTTTVSSPQNTTPNADGTVTQNPPAKTAETTPADTQNWIKTQLQRIFGLQGTKGAATQQAENEANITGLTAQKTSDYNAYMQAKMDQINQIESMKHEAGGSTGGNAQAIAEYTRLTDAHISNLAIQAQISQGALTDAQAMVNAKIDAIFSPLVDQEKTLNDIATQNNNDLTDSQKIQMTEMANQKATDRADVTKTANDLGTQMVQNRAPVAVQDAVDKIMHDYVAGNISAEDAKIKMAEAAGKYGIDQSKNVDIAYKQAQTDEINQKIRDARDAGNSTVPTQDPNGNTLNVPTSAAGYFNFSNNGNSYVDFSTLQGTATEKAQAIKDIVNYNKANPSNPIKIITNKNTAADLQNIDNAMLNLKTIQDAFDPTAPDNAAARDTYAAGMNRLSNFLQTNPDISSLNTFQDTGLDILKAISGIQGFRGGQGVIQTVKDTLPQIGDTKAVVDKKLNNIRTLISNRETSLVGAPRISKGVSATLNGKTYTYNGTGDTSDIKNWTLQQ